MKYYYFVTKGGLKSIKITNYEINTVINKNYELMTDEQVAFYEDHPTASVNEVMNCRLIEIPEPTLEEVRLSKIIEIDSYDCSEEVNIFYYQGQSMWLDKAARVGLVNLCDSLEIIGEDNVKIWYGSGNIELSITQCRQLLASLEVYAMRCYNVTAQHKSNVMALQTIEAITNYDYTTGYPDKLNL